MVAEGIRDGAYELATTLPDERVFKVLRGGTEKSPNGRLSRLSRWSMVDASEVLPDFEYPFVAPSVADRASSQGMQFPKGTLHVDSEDGSDMQASYDMIDPIPSDKVDFPMSEPARWNLTAFKWAMVMLSPLAAQNLRNAWLSLLLPIGSLIYLVKERTIMGIVVFAEHRQVLQVK